MADISLLFDFVAKYEGGQSKSSKDSASKGYPPGFVHTNRGIVWSTYQGIAPKVGLDPSYDAFLAMTKAGQQKIMGWFWDDVRGDQINTQAIAGMCFEILWGSGNIHHIYDSLNVLGFPDKYPGGQVPALGPKALGFINAYPDQAKLFNQIAKDRAGVYAHLRDTQPVYGAPNYAGWMRRLNDYIKSFPVKKKSSPPEPESSSLPVA